MSPLAAVGYPLFALAALNLYLGLFLLRRRTTDPVVPYAAAIGLINTVYCTVVALAYVCAAYGLEYAVFYRSAWVGWVSLAPATQIILTLKGRVTAARRWGRFMYAFWGGVFVLCLSTNVVEGGAVSLIPFVDRLGPFERVGRAAGAATLVWALWQLFEIRDSSVGRRRQQIGYFLFGLAAYAVAGLMLAGVLQIVGGVAFDPALVSYFSLVWMAATVYAITRHRLFDVRFLFSHAVTALLLTLVLVTFNVATFEWIKPAVGARGALVAVSIVAAVILFMTPLVSSVRGAAARLLAPRRYDPRRAVKESAHTLAALVGVDDILRHLLRLTRDTVAAASGMLYLRDGDRFRKAHAYDAEGTPDELAAGSALVQWLNDCESPFVRDEQQMAMLPGTFARVAADLDRCGGELALAIRYHDDVLAILILGRKSNRDAFFNSDLDVLETFADQAAIALINARLVEELRTAVRARDDFVSVAGHELRTPMMALQLNVEILARLLPRGDADVRERLEITQRQVARLTRLLDELLDVSRVTAQRLTLEREPPDLCVVVREVADRFRDEIERSRCRVDLDATSPVVGSWDRLRLEQVVTNLLSNALKYGASRPIAIRVEHTEGVARLTVTDHGIGIDHADLGRIFERFERAVSQHNAGGFGLGLWITKHLVEAHGGRIQVRSTPGAGSTFIVELPVYEDAARPGA